MEEQKVLYFNKSFAIYIRSQGTSKYCPTMFDHSYYNEIRQSQQCLKILSKFGGSNNPQPLKTSLTECKINLIITQQIALSPSEFVQYVCNQYKQKDTSIAVIKPSQKKHKYQEDSKRHSQRQDGRNQDT
ncbi:hypothetical protein ABPG74_005772 [Tetrahymena malaccensis]